MSDAIAPPATAPTPDVDVVIVGSGPVGSAFARVLSELGPTRILLVDRGPALSTPPGANLKNFLAGGVRQVSDDTDVATVPAESLARTGTELWTSRRGPADEFPGAATSTNVGGMGAHWSCATPEPTLEERGDVVPPDVWPELLAESARLLASSTSAFAGSRRGAAMTELLDAAFGDRLERRVQVMPHACRRTPDGRLDWTGADTVLGPLLTAPGDSFELRPATLCRRVLLDESGTRAIGVELVDAATGRSTTVHSRCVVVAADSLRTPQLLWASGVRPAALGRHLNEHPMIAATVLLTDEAMAGVPDASAEDCGDQRAAVWVPYAAPDHRFSGQIENSPGSPAGFEIEALRRAPRSRIVSLTWFCPKEPLADNRLEFLDSADDSGLPAVAIHYRLSGRDQASVARGIELTTLAGNAIGEFVAGEEPALLSDGLSLHYMGTTRMGRIDDGTSVCDSNSRVWGVQGLYVGGNGVIPVATAGNPTRTSVALAVRAARAIAADLAASPAAPAHSEN